jgi:hypothetical protein
MILLIENPLHPGIALISAAYKRAFEFLGVDFHFLSFRKEPQSSIDEINTITQSVIKNYNKIIVVQPTFFTGQTFLYALQMQQKGRKFYCINTEDPYSTSGILAMNSLFEIKFTNEKIVADTYASINFKYLPVAFDSLMPYKKAEEKEYDICSIMTYYKERFDLLDSIPKDLKVFKAGSISPLIRDGALKEDTKGINCKMIPRHKEYEYYSKSKFVLNPHRSPELVGKSYLNLIEGQPCIPIFKEAVSPNPRFFDAIGCGAIPLNDESRTECFRIVNNYDCNDNVWKMYELSFLQSCDKMDKKEYDIITEHQRKCFINETYIKRAEQVLNEISK